MESVIEPVFIVQNDGHWPLTAFSLARISMRPLLNVTLPDVVISPEVKCYVVPLPHQLDSVASSRFTRSLSKPFSTTRLASFLAHSSPSVCERAP